MRLISFDGGEGDRLGVEHTDGRIWSSRTLQAGMPETMSDLLGAGRPALEALREAVGAAASSDLPGDVDPATRIAPVPRPGKIIAVGLNYHDHAKEGRMDLPTSPMIFAKFSTSVIGHGDTIEWDPDLTAAVDLEAELGVVIGTTARRVAEADALDHVVGYTCVNDVSARDLQFADKQFVRSKSLDTFCPMGPALVTTDEVGDPQRLAICCTVGGERVQEASTSQMYFSVAQIISHCSAAFTLDPGDVIATGTPSGVGVFRDPPRFLTAGDVVTVEIERIGRLDNTCAFETVGGLT